MKNINWGLVWWGGAACLMWIFGIKNGITLVLIIGWQFFIMMYLTQIADKLGISLELTKKEEKQF